MQRLIFTESNTSGTGRLFARAARPEGLAPSLLSDDRTRRGHAAGGGIEDAAHVPGIVEARLYLPQGSKLQLCGDFRDRGGRALACGDDASPVREAAQAARPAIRLGMQMPEPSASASAGSREKR